MLPPLKYDPERDSRTLMVHLERLDQERRDFGPGYHDHGVLFFWEDGRPPHPDTITRRFKRLSAAEGLPEIDLHDVGTAMPPLAAMRGSTGRR